MPMYARTCATERKRIMEKTLTLIFGPNYKTSTWGMLLGTLPGLLSVGCGVAGLLHIPIPGVSVTGDPWAMIQAGWPLIVAGGVGWLAKDGDVTGGTRKAPSQ